MPSLAAVEVLPALLGLEDRLPVVADKPGGRNGDSVLLMLLLALWLAAGWKESPLLLVPADTP
jgi:hypothetical protein